MSCPLKNLAAQTLILTALLLAGAASAAEEQVPREIRFASVPDIFNWNIPNPTPGWEDAASWFFDRLHEGRPDFTLIAGDIMDARWYEPELVKQETEAYWSGFKKRFDDREMTVYIAPGDHEYGDDKGLTMGDISRLFGEQFTQVLGMPRNGPDNHKGRAFYVREGNLLVITLDTFEDAGERFAYTVGNEQLAWMNKVLTDQQDAEFIIVQGHLPIVGPVRSKNSSANMLEGGTSSALWKLMVEHGVDVYLCGEHHRITVYEKDGIYQVVHGALWGTQTDLNYMRGVVTPGRLTLELLEFDVEYSGDYLGNHPNRGPKHRPRENVTITEASKTNGPRMTGKLVLTTDSKGEAMTSEATGWFARENHGTGSN